jgi:predicted nucleic acid-binding protein
MLGLRTAEVAAAYRLRGADAVYVALAEALHAPLVTWDQEQLTRLADLIPVFTPDSGPGDPPGSARNQPR